MFFSIISLILKLAIKNLQKLSTFHNFYFTTGICFWEPNTPLLFIRQENEILKFILQTFVFLVHVTPHYITNIEVHIETRVVFLSERRSNCMVKRNPAKVRYFGRPPMYGYVLDWNRPNQHVMYIDIIDDSGSTLWNRFHVSRGKTGFVFQARCVSLVRCWTLDMLDILSS